MTASPCRPPKDVSNVLQSAQGLSSDEESGFDLMQSDALRMGRATVCCGSTGSRREIRVPRYPRTLWTSLAALLMSPWLAVPALADGESDKFDLTFHRKADPDTWIRPSAQFQTAFFTTKKAYGGNTRENLGNDARGWIELGLVPALDGQLSLGDNGTIRVRTSGVWTSTQVGTDAAGSTLTSDGRAQAREKLTLEDAYIGWNSGKLFADSLGENAIDLSFGSQPYQIGPGGPDGDGLGSGFIFYNGGDDGDKRGGFWLGLRNAFQLAGIARLHTGALDAEAVYLRSDELGNVNTEVVGTRLGYDFAELLDMKLARLTGAYWNLLDSDDRRRDGLNVVNLGLDVRPLKDLPGLRFTGEYVYERNQSKNKSWAAWGEVGYTFEEVSWKPHASYRIAHFSGDDGQGKNNNFDALFWGFSDWNYWFLGEISGEYLTQNTNLTAYVLRLRSNPTDAITLNFFWIYQRLDNLENNTVSPRPPLSPRVSDIDDHDLSHEIDFIVDWSPNDYLKFSLVAAYLFPLSGGEDLFGGDDTWQHYMLWTSLSF